MWYAAPAACQIQPPRVRPERSSVRYTRPLVGVILGALISGLGGFSVAHGLKIGPDDRRLSPPAPHLVVASAPGAPDLEWRTAVDAGS